MSKDLLKEAIADAKAVRETAIANAKLALEEAFTPKLQSMLSAKLQEDDVEDEEEVDVDAVEMAHGDEEAEEGMHADDETEEGMHGDDEAEEGMREEEEEEAEEGMREEDDEEGDLDLEEIIKELEGEDEDEAEEGMREQSDSTDVGKGDNKMDQADNDTEDPGKGKLSEEADDEEELDLDEVIRSLTEEDDEDEAEEGMREEDDKEAELEEAYETIRSLKSTLQEVNLLNAKLLFSNKLFKGNNLSESQKLKVIETFDRASNLREVKLVYTTLAESFTGKTVKKGLTEGFASKKSNSTAPKGQIVESNGMADRMKRLAGLL